jgi:hypothetical protein
LREFPLEKVDACFQFIRHGDPAWHASSAANVFGRANEKKK